MNKRFVRGSQYRRNALTAALAVGLGFTGLAYGQATTGSIFGTAPVAAGETVRITNNSNGATREVPVDSKGRFKVGSLPLGTYSVSLVNGGQVVATHDNVAVTVGGGTSVPFTAAASEQEAQNLSAVQVVASALPSIDVTSVTSNTIITSKDLAQLPLSHSAEAIALLAPGTAQGSGYFGNAIAFGGSSVSENAYYVNGYDTGEPYRNIGGFSLPYGAIDQQQTITGGYSAKYGRSDGGVINQVGKSGTNDWHFGGQVAWEPKFAASGGDNVYYPHLAIPANTTGIPEGTPITDRPDKTEPDKVYHYKSSDYPNGLPYSLSSDSLPGTMYQYKNDNKSWQTVYSAYLGGPLIKDKLFLFLAAEKTKTSTTDVQSSQDDQVNLYQDRSSKFYGKLDWNINDNNHVAFTAMRNNQSDNEGATYAYDYSTFKRGDLLSQNDVSKDNAKFYIGQYTGYFGDNASLNVLWGKGDFDDPVIYANQSTLPYVSTGGLVSKGTNDQTTSRRYAENASNATHGLRADFTYHLGDHSLGIGIDNMYYKAKNQGENSSGPGYEWVYTSAPKGTTPGTVVQEVYDVRTSMSTTQKAYYLQDDWQLSQAVLLSIGVRNDHFINYNNAGEEFVDEKNQWEPRLGLSWDVFGDSSFKVYANAGRYYLALPLNAAERAADASTLTYQYYNYMKVDGNGIPVDPVLTTSPAGTTAPWSPDGEYGAPKNTKEVTARNLKPEYMDEFIIGFDKQLNDKWTYGAKVSSRDLKAAIDDECSPGQIATKMASMGLNPDDYSDSLYGASYCRLINPGETNTILVNKNDGSGSTLVKMTKADWGYQEGVKRKIYSVDAYLEHPFDGKWTARIDYTWTHGFGNTEGQVRSDFGQADVSKTEDWDNWALMDGQSGELLNTRKHQIRIRGAYQITPEWLVSGNALIQSGMPEECLGYYGVYDIGDPAGYNGGNTSNYHWCGGKMVHPGFKHTPWTHEIDLGVHYRPAFAAHKLGFNLDVFNLLNEQKPLQTDPNYEIIDHQIDNMYGMGLFYETPRYIRLSVSYDF